MLQCMDCKSLNIVEIELYEAWFREGTMVRKRHVTIFQNSNDVETMFFASCPELSKSATTKAPTREVAIEELSKLLKGMYGVKLLAKEIEL